MASFINKKPVSRMETDTSASGSREEPSLRFSELRRADEGGVEQLCHDPVASIGGPDEDAPHPENQELSSASSISFLTRSEDNDVEEAETSSETTSTFEDLEDLEERVFSMTNLQTRLMTTRRTGQEIFKNQSLNRL